MPTNDFEPFATAAGANVVSQPAYKVSPFLSTGFQSGIADSASFNKVWRQSSIIAAAVAQLIVDVVGVDVLDDGTIATIEQNLLRLLRQSGQYVVDSGSANTIVVTLNPAPATLSTLLGVPLYVKVAAANTGATTINVNSFGGIAVTTNALAALTANILATGGIFTLMYDGTRFQIV